MESQVRNKKMSVEEFIRGAREKRIEKKMSRTNEGVKSLAQWCWRRFGGNEVKGQDYTYFKPYNAEEKYGGFRIKGVKDMYNPGYWGEWTDILDKTIKYDSGYVKILSNGVMYVLVKGILTKNGLDKWLEHTFGGKLMYNAENSQDTATILKDDNIMDKFIKGYDKEDKSKAPTVK